MLLCAADLGLTWWRFRPMIAALSTARPTETAYMRQAGISQPVRAPAWSDLDSVAPAAVCAVVAAEDFLFFEHGAFDWNAQSQLFRRVLRGDLSAGASSIAQQLARNLFLGHDRSVRRKAREYVLAVALSRALSKRRQLELYLNVVEWGPGVWGIDSASRHWFAKPASALTPTDAALLASILPAPERGLSYAASASARQAHQRITDALWNAALVDGLGRSGTLARVRLWADNVASGVDPEGARAVVEQEMGPEPPARSGHSNGDWDGAQCDQTRRGGPIRWRPLTLPSAGVRQ
jgi:monofunctional biosynthetic peptidoglycan transglycosylase